MSTSILVAPNQIFGQQDQPLAYQKDIVRQFVGAGHRDLDKVKTLLEEYPNLIYSSHDWGGGDFETAIGAGGHVGYVDMVDFLLEKGARPTIHVLAMLGKEDLVLPLIKAYPALINSLGPHGFTLLYHARKSESEALIKYLVDNGAPDGKMSLWE